MIRICKILYNKLVWFTNSDTMQQILNSVLIFLFIQQGNNTNNNYVNEGYSEAWSTVKSRFYVKSRIYIEQFDDIIERFLSILRYTVSRFYDAFAADHQ